ncbi:MAG: RDD family protein [Treponema sp.]|nr:RDD family protein [Treponema sp.]
MDTKRVVAGIIDFFITCIIQTILMALFLLKPLLEMGGDVEIFNIMIRNMIITYASLSYLIFRDVLGKRSIGKLIMKLKIIDKNGGKETGFIKRILRNLTWILGPIDIIVFFITKERLGDKIAGTNVVEK